MKSRLAWPPLSSAQRHALERAVDEGRHDVAPDRRGGAAPDARAERLARPVDVLEARAHRRQPEVGVVPDAVELAHDLGDLVRAVVVERDRAILGDGRRILVRLLRQRAARGAVDDAAVDRQLAQPVEQLDRRQQVVLVVEQRLGDRVLVPVEGGQVVDLVVARLERRRAPRRRRSSPRRSDTRASSGTAQRSAESRLSTTVTRAAPLGQRAAHEVRADEAGAADDEQTSGRRASGPPCVTRAPRAACRCVNVCSTPRSRYQAIARATPSRQRGGGRPAERLDGARRVEQDAERVVLAALAHLDLVRRQLERRDRGVVQLLDREVGARGGVVGARLARAAHRAHQQVDEVVDEDEVAPRVHDEAGLVVGQPVVERRQRPARDCAARRRWPAGTRRTARCRAARSARRRSSRSRSWSRTGRSGWLSVIGCSSGLMP